MANHIDFDPSVYRKRGDAMENQQLLEYRCVKETMIVEIMGASPSIIRVSSAWAKPNKGEKQGIMRNATKFEAAANQCQS
jgi:hypothetical protein